MMQDVISVIPTVNDRPYRSVNEVYSDYVRGKPVLVRGYGPLSGLTVDVYEERTLKALGIKAIEFCLGGSTKEVVL
jgi:hypothetical protein